MSREHAYAYEAGYRDGSINYELEHCPACKNIADLQEALAENAKLRELVWDMWNGMCGYAHECRSCEHYELYEGQRFVGECEYHRRIRELGIEVDDA